jgi:HD-like signal output (HDOD) protein
MELQKAFQNVGRLERFWDSSAVTAHMSAWIAQRINSKFVRPVDAYTFGLFHDCGIPLLLAPFKEYVSVLEQANAEGTELFTDIEDHHLSINHATIGAQLATEWLLPTEIAEAILHHHNPQALTGQCGITERSRHSIAISQMAEHFHNHHTGLSKSREWDKLGTICLNLMGISAPLLEDLYRESAAVMDRKAI